MSRTACSDAPTASSPRASTSSRRASHRSARVDKALEAKIRHVGNPVRPAVIEAAKTPYDEPRDGGELRLLVFGGSQGARIMSDIVPPAVAEARRARAGAAQHRAAGARGGCGAGQGRLCAGGRRGRDRALLPRPAGAPGAKPARDLARRRLDGRRDLGDRPPLDPRAAPRLARPGPGRECGIARRDRGRHRAAATRNSCPRGWPRCSPSCYRPLGVSPRWRALRAPAPASPTRPNAARRDLVCVRDTARVEIAPAWRRERHEAPEPARPHPFHRHRRHRHVGHRRGAGQSRLRGAGLGRRRRRQSEAPARARASRFMSGMRPQISARPRSSWSRPRSSATIPSSSRRARGACRWCAAPRCSPS